MAKEVAKKTEAAKEKKATSGARLRLYSRAVFLGFRRGLRRQHEQQALVRIEGVNTRRDARFYLGKKVAYLYKAKTVNGRTGSKNRAIWGKVIHTHGNNGVVRAKFSHNLPPKAISRPLRVMLFPSNI